MDIESEPVSFRAVSKLEPQAGSRRGLPNLKHRLAQGLCRFLFELTPLFIIVGFFWLQVRLSTETTGFASTILTVLIFMVELGLLTIWSFVLP